MSRTSRFAIVATYAPIVAILAALVFASPSHAAAFDWNSSPNMIAKIAPGTYLSVENQCPQRGYFSEFSAYSAKGTRYAQHRSRDGLLFSWTTPRGRVTFDGLTFRNRSPRNVYVAGWCG